jgi:DNA helicase-4
MGESGSVTVGGPCLESFKTEWSGRRWNIVLTEGNAVVSLPKGSTTIPGTEANNLQLKGWFNRKLYLSGRRIARLRGISSEDSLELKMQLRRLAVLPEIAAALSWFRETDGWVKQSVARGRWITSEFLSGQISKIPSAELTEQIDQSGLWDALTIEETNAIWSLRDDWGRRIDRANEEIRRSELRARKAFFDTIEKSPLTEEQANAVICMDNRVQLLAAAGSGKTSVMISRAAYAVDRGFIAPERILLLAFNKNAATELEERIKDRFSHAGINSTGVKAATFHSFGLNLIGRATGRKPRLASWLENSGEHKKVEEIVDRLRDSTPEFRYKWDLYRLIFANAPTGLTDGVPDGFDTTVKQGFNTLDGKVVRSHGERLIADFLYLNGVEYEYESRYPFTVPTATKGEYRPDFYYPKVNVWHEHWGLDSNGKPHPKFANYLEDMKWKRAEHKRNGTALIETTWAEVMFGDGLVQLQDHLERHGIEFDWDPDREVLNKWVRPLKHEDLVRLIRTFMAHVKSNSLTREALKRKLRGATTDDNFRGSRSQMFLDLYWPIHEEWQKELLLEGSIDFEDMLLRAADLLHSGNVESQFDMVLVDEFQDASRVRARLIQGLVDRPGRILLTVGDDWQAINRFAGADISVMREFEKWFGSGKELALTKTFRCPETICDVSKNFVQKNPFQIRKQMKSGQSNRGLPVKVVLEKDPSDLAGTLRQLSESIASGDLPGFASGKTRVDVLARYNFQLRDRPRSVPSNLDVKFRTVHGSKGLEADYVVITGLTAGIYGFPSAISDDPVLQLAMPESDPFPNAEERRLFFVALTRARRQVIILSSSANPSSFVMELLGNPSVEFISSVGAQILTCPKCKKGILATKTGSKGPFLGCSTFPACTHTQRVP